MVKYMTKVSYKGEKLSYCYHLMKTILRSDIPKDFSYYRTGSKVFYEYYKNYTELIIHRIGKRYEFLRAGRIIGNIYSVIIEKIDTEPTREILKKIGIHHGIVFW